MAWGIKYYTEFTDILGVNWKIDIEEDAFSGTAISLQSTGSPLNIEYLSTSEDFIGNPICGSVASISVYSDADFSFTEFYSYGRLTYRISIYYNTTLFWQGYINAEGYQEPYDGISYPVLISASDMLGQLKDKPYKYTTSTVDDTYYNGLRKESQVVLDILGKINITQFTEYVNIYEDRMVATDTDSPFNQIKIDVDVFKDMNCYQVLSEVLKKYNAVIRQIAGKMIIYRPVDLKLLPIKGRVFTAVDTISAATDLSSEVLFDRTGSTSDFHDTDGGSLSIIAPAKKASLNQDYGYKESWIENYDFKIETFSYPTWQNWTNPAWSLNNWVPEEKDGWAYAAGATPYSVGSEQTFGTYLKATDDMCVLSFDYYLYSYYGADLTDITISMKIKADNADKWLGVDDEEVATWHDTEVYVDVTDATILNGRNGWVNFTRSISQGLPANGPYTINLYNPYCADSVAFACGIKNIKFCSTSTKTYMKRRTRSFWNRIDLTGGGSVYGDWTVGLRNKYYRTKVSEPADDRNVVEYTHVKTNAIEGQELEYNYILGDVPVTSSPAHDADTDLDNTIEQFAGALVITPIYSKAEAATNFDANYSAHYPGITVTHSGDTVIFTENNGLDFTGSTGIVNATGNLSGSVAATQGHTTALPAICTIPITGTNGSATVGANGESETMSWYGSTVADTIDNWITNNDSTYATAGATPSRSSNSLVFTTASGVDFTAFPTFSTIGGDLDTTGEEDTQDPVVGIPRIDTVTLTGTTGTANITCDAVTRLAYLTGITESSATWSSRGNTEASWLLDIVGDEIIAQYARPKISLSVPIIEKADTSNLPHIDICGYFRDNLNVNQLLTPIRTVTLWTAYQCTLTANWPYMRYTTTSAAGSGSYIYLTSDISIDGSIYRYINIRYKVVSGAASGGEIFYKTGSHSYSDSYRKDFTLIADGDWHVLILDMSSLTAGGTDWTDNTITNIRFDLTDAHPVVLDLDWIGFPRKFVFNGGVFNVRDRQWDIDLNEIIYE